MLCLEVCKLINWLRFAYFRLSSLGARRSLVEGYSGVKLPYAGKILCKSLLYMELSAFWSKS